ncbi:hypothetical protein DNTS_001288 [Danionella cerebrum]|uniref:C2H2-type domain-containing protein n=1 Tax=Danionella cerebrum TaxID=2873325 RepID=A0A553Q3P4_9TELE|nr:hypothetical protein DNTS_001288 [Danionella translucida]
MKPKVKKNTCLSSKNKMTKLLQNVETECILSESDSLCTDADTTDSAGEASEWEKLAPMRPELFGDPSSDEHQLQKERRVNGPPSPDFRAFIPKTESDCIPVNPASFQVKSEPGVYEVFQSEPTVDEETEIWRNVKLEAPGEIIVCDSEHEEANASSTQIFPCPHCSVTFTEFSYLDQHLKWGHRSEYLSWVKSHKVYNCSKITSGMLSCSSCHYRFFSQKELEAHERKVHLPAPKPVRKLYTCPHCDRSFDYIGNLQNHCRRCHGLSTVCSDGHISCAACGQSFAGVWGQGPHRCHENQTQLSVDEPMCTDRGYSCKDCGKNFPTLQGLKVHKRIHTGEKPYICGDCGHSFHDMGSMLKHKVIHTGIRPYKCPECNKDFARMGHLRSHLRTHTGERPYPCPQCGMRFSHRSTLQIHQDIHSKEKVFPCSVCGKTFSAMRYVKAHQRAHNSDRIIQCRVCMKTFSREDVLKKHLRIHTGERPYFCKVCSKRFVRIQHLKNHMRTHTGEKPYRCEQCGSCYTQSGDLTKHMRKHTGEKPYACPDCDRRFSNSGDLGKHRRSHTGTRPYQCLECGKSFLLSQHLKSHKNTHTGERPFSCPKCHRTFTRSHHLSQHLEKHI